MRGRVLAWIAAVITMAAVLLVLASGWLTRPKVQATLRETGTGPRVEPAGTQVMVTAAPPASASRDVRLFMAGISAGVLGNIMVAVVVTDFSVGANPIERLAWLLILTFLMLALITVALTTTDLLAALFDWIAMTFIGLSLLYSFLGGLRLLFAECGFCPSIDVAFRGTVVFLGMAATVWILRRVTVPSIHDLAAELTRLRRGWFSES